MQLTQVVIGTKARAEGHAGESGGESEKVSR